ncbi:unnamed protein product [Effrenium voratum]|nr:unnamed protein product [Effrenium voratum]
MSNISIPRSSSLRMYFRAKLTVYDLALAPTGRESKYGFCATEFLPTCFSSLLARITAKCRRRRFLLATVEPTGRLMARALSEVIDDLGVGWYHALVVLFCSGLMLADGAEMLMVSSIVGALDGDLEAGKITRGLLVSTSFLGMLLGNLLSGSVSGRYGRWCACMTSTVLLSFFGLLCSVIETMFQLFVTQFCLGLAIGVGGPASVTLLTETAPTRSRGTVSNSASFAFTLGEAWTALGLLLFMPELKGPWRLLCIWGVLPALLVAPFGLLVHESPSWLQLHERHHELRALLASIRRMHGKDEVDILVQPMLSTSSSGTFKILIQGEHCRTIGLGCTLAFVMNYLFFGTTFAFTQIFAEAEGDWTSPSMEMLVVAAAELGGIFLAWFLLWHPKIGRIAALRLLCVFSAIFSTCLISVVYGLFGIADPAAYGLKAMVSAMFPVLYLYVSEVLPVALRAKGVGFCMSLGRVGSVAAPALYAVGNHMVHSAGPFIASMVILSAAGYVAASHLVVETCGRPLDTPCLEMTSCGREAKSKEAKSRS